MNELPKITIIPPVIPLTTMGMGALLHSIWPIQIVGSTIPLWSGSIIAGLSFIPAILAVWSLRNAGTTADVRRKASKLVTQGIFRYSRNPMYLSMMMLCLAVALMSNSLIMLLLVVPTGSALCLAVIRKEEFLLQSEFGNEYAAYCRSTGRWI